MRIADGAALVFTRYLRGLLFERNRVLREIVESNRWGESLAGT
ncbi:hypothetical protein OV203_46950 [Nannocystis sp. ILAH1]|nr:MULTISPECIES: hypothetical protein [unclassified Nannocystis]MCY0994755.1 hypothetical protein [Nannocystis sp. ILAH1]MCY1065375.1 hypothetical protein [Nannocystis sp. RBIL2]